MAYFPKDWFALVRLRKRNGTYRFDLSFATLISGERHEAGMMGS
jgi:hypothetical protein